MGEIKSTLDLVMEKTKGLNLSDEERRGQKDKEIGSRIRGLLNKFQDEAISFDRFKSEYLKLQKNYDFSKNDHLIKEIYDQIELGADNRALFELLTEFKVPDIEAFSSVLQEFQTALDTAADQRRKVLKAHLAKTHFVSGSAVVPNLENDDEWQKEVEEIRAEFETKLNQEKTKLLSG